jgi:hypothetical protein
VKFQRPKIDDVLSVAESLLVLEEVNHVYIRLVGITGGFELSLNSMGAESVEMILYPTQLRKGVRLALNELEKKFHARKQTTESKDPKRKETGPHSFTKGNEEY